MQILIAEDNIVSTRLLAHLLGPMGECEIVANGEEAVELVGFCLDEGSHFELICLDIMMPVMDGREALKRIRELEDKHNVEPERRAKIMFTTVVPQDNADNEGIEDMYQGYLGKPYSKKDLFAVLSAVGLEHPEAE